MNPLMTEFETILKQLTNLEFMVRCCLNTTYSDLKNIRKLLIMARNTIQNNIDQDLEESLMIQVSQALHRLDTFIFLQNFSSNQVEHWLQFSKADLLEECKKLLENNQYQGALILWNRHQSEFDIQETEVLNLLSCLPRLASPESADLYNGCLV